MYLGFGWGKSDGDDDGKKRDGEDTGVCNASHWIRGREE